MGGGEGGQAGMGGGAVPGARSVVVPVSRAACAVHSRFSLATRLPFLLLLIRRLAPRGFRRDKQTPLSNASVNPVVLSGS